MPATLLTPPRSRSAAQLEREANLLKEELQYRRVHQDPYYWLTSLTKTKDEQAVKNAVRYANEHHCSFQEAVQQLGEEANPYKPFPDREYLRWVIEALKAEPILFVEKSRTMMLSWVVSAFCAHWGFTMPATCCVFQSQDLDRAIHDIGYVKTLWEQSPAWLKKRWPLEKPLDKFAQDELKLANGTKFKAIPGDPDKIRSEHPTIVVLDEAAHIEQGETSYNVAMGASPVKVFCISSAAPGWFQEVSDAAKPVPWPYKLPTKAA